ncbi:MAG: hypothetical protein FWD13_10255 [Treponema sp.]|nr:hypothetical protein [Treponema sp.]
MKKIFLLCVFSLICAIATVGAQELNSNASFLWELDFLENNPNSGVRNYSTGYSNFSVGGKLGVGFLNIFLGLGSYISGEWGDGLFLTLFQGGGAGLAFWGYYLITNNDLQFGSGRFWRGTGGVFLSCLGVGLYGLGIINSFLFLFGVGYGGGLNTFNPPSVDRIRNEQRREERELRRRSWDMNMAFLPLPDGYVGLISLSTSY